MFTQRSLVSPYLRAITSLGFLFNRSYILFFHLDPLFFSAFNTLALLNCFTWLENTKHGYIYLIGCSSCAPRCWMLLKKVIKNMKRKWTLSSFLSSTIAWFTGTCNSKCPREHTIFPRKLFLFSLSNWMTLAFIQFLKHLNSLFPHIINQSSVASSLVFLLPPFLLYTLFLCPEKILIQHNS